MDFEIEKPAFALIDTDESVLNVSWDELKKADVDDDGVIVNLQH